MNTDNPKGSVEYIYFEVIEECTVVENQKSEKLKEWIQLVAIMTIKSKTANTPILVATVVEEDMDFGY